MSKIVTISEAASIAMHSMVLIAKSEKMLSVSEIAEMTCSSKHHVAKILHRLVQTGCITSQRGPSGGFKLKKNPEEISLLSIFESIEGDIEISSCHFNKEKCPFEKCIMGNYLQKMTKDFSTFLDKKTLDTFISEN